MKRIWEKSRKKLLAFCMAALLVYLAFAMNNTYAAYTSLIIGQQQQHLLLISRAVSQNLELYISEQLRNVRTLTQTSGFIDGMEAYYRAGEMKIIKEYIFSYMLSNQQGPSRMYLLDDKGEQIFHYNQYPFLEEFDESVLNLGACASESESGIGSVFTIGQGRSGMTLINSVYGGSGYLGTVVSVFDLDALYKEFVAPLNVDNVGYIVVKNEDRTVIMHPDSRMLQFNCERDIQGFRELPQYKSQGEMLDAQYSCEEGTAIYHSYSGGILPPEKEIAAFCRMNLSGTSWYISAAMPYNEAVEIEHDNLRRFGMLFSAVLMVVVASGAIIYILLRNRQKLKLETRYLKEINSTLEELHQSREEARHYQKLTTIGTLAGGIAHEFNNLLTPILGYSEFLKEQMGGDNEFYEDLEEIHKAGLRAKEIVERILPFSRKESQAGAFKSLNLGVVVREAVKTIGLVRPANIRIEEALEDRGVNVYGSATQLHQVLLNLLSNACQSMEPDGGTLTLRTRCMRREELPEGYRDVAGESFVEVQVEDTGCGMEEGVLHQIFNPFFTTKETGEGTGLGLAVVKDILISHGGFMRVESQPGSGSCFYLYLPVAAGAQPMGEPAAVEKTGEVKNISLILVDDEERVVKYLSKRLERRGFRVEGYTSPAEALTAVENSPGRFQVMVVDYMMPGYKGTVLAGRVKRQQPYLGIVMITGLVEADALQMNQDGVIDAILQKPVNFEQLVQAVSQAAHGDVSV